MSQPNSHTDGATQPPPGDLAKSTPGGEWSLADYIPQSVFGNSADSSAGSALQQLTSASDRMFAFSPSFQPYPLPTAAPGKMIRSESPIPNFNMPPTLNPVMVIPDAYEGSSGQFYDPGQSYLNAASVQNDVTEDMEFDFDMFFHQMGGGELGLNGTWG